MLFDEVNEPFHRLGFGDVEFDRLFADVKVDLSRRASHVTEIRVRHLAGAVHNTAHDRDLHALEMFRARLDPRRHSLQIEQCAAA